MRSWPVLLAVMLLLAPPQPALGGEGPRANDLGVYHTFDEMVSELENLSAAHPAILRMESIGTTFEGRDVWAVKLSDNVTQDESEPNITIFGGIHAGELIGVEVALYILFSLVENYTTNATVGWYVNRTQLWFVPMLNPDGHAYVEQGNSWRKNRRPNPGGTFGVDLNRNFGHLWGLQASHNPPDEEYCGPYAFSENETQAVDRLVSDHPPTITLSYHAFGQYILYPWGNSINQEPVDSRLPEIAADMSLAMPEGRRYLPMYAREMYAASGDTDDWFYMNRSILPFTIELSTSYRPLDSAVAGICADNLGPALYVLNYTVGAPPPPPPKRSLSIEGPDRFNGTHFGPVFLNFTLNNTGQLPEDISITVSANDTLWAGNDSFTLSSSRTGLEAGKGTVIRLMVRIPPFFPPDRPVGISLNATADSGVACIKHLTGTADIVRFIGVFFSSPGGEMFIEPGGSVRGNVTVWSLGNIPETVDVSVNVSAGSYEGPFPGRFVLAPGESRNISLSLHAPQRLEGGSAITLTVDAASADGKLRQLWTSDFRISIDIDVRLVPAVRNLTLKDRETATVAITIQNLGNMWHNGTLLLGGDDTFCILERSHFNISPYSSAHTNLTIKGRKGSWALNMTFRSRWRELDDKIYYTVLANNTSRPASPDYRPTIIVVVVLVVVVAAVGLWWMHRRRRSDSKEGDAP